MVLILWRYLKCLRQMLIFSLEWWQLIVYIPVSCRYVLRYISSRSLHTLLISFVELSNIRATQGDCILWNGNPNWCNWSIPHDSPTCVEDHPVKGDRPKSMLSKSKYDGLRQVPLYLADSSGSVDDSGVDIPFTQGDYHVTIHENGNRDQCRTEVPSTAEAQDKMLTINSCVQTNTYGRYRWDLSIICYPTARLTKIFLITSNHSCNWNPPYKYWVTIESGTW